MADITRWDPFAEMATVRNAFDRLFDERPLRSFFGEGNGTQSYFPVDVFETGDEIVVKASLPGFKPEDIDVQIHGAGVHCSAPRTVTYSRPPWWKPPRPLKNDKSGCGTVSSGYVCEGTRGTSGGGNGSPTRGRSI